jgi:hypothetical protein
MLSTTRILTRFRGSAALYLHDHIAESASTVEALPGQGLQGEMMYRERRKHVPESPTFQPAVCRVPLAVCAAVLLAGVVTPSSAIAKNLIEYFQPTPIACPLTKSTWGASSSVPRDTCNGLEDTKNPPQWLYWDGKILRAKDGKYHLLASRWPASQGHNGGWGNSDAILAVSDALLGPYVDKGFAYTDGPDSRDRSKGHNVSGCELPDGTYCLIVSEIVPFTIFTSPSLDGPWTNKGHAQIDSNGVQISLSGDTHLESNVSLVVRPDGNFQIIQRHGIIALSTTGILGPYKVQRPTTKYSAAETPPANFPTVYPVRQKHTTADPYAPSTIENMATYAEDPLIWYSGGQYHVVYDYPDDKVGYHLTSMDGIHDWTDQGFAYDPRMAKQLFSYTDGSVVSWTKMERPNVIMENGHITHFTFSVTDVEKAQISGGSNHGNKVIVMAFDGVAFDAETGVGGLDGGTPGSGGQVGKDAGAAGGNVGGMDAGSSGVDGNSGPGGRGGSSGGTGGALGRGGASGVGGATATGNGGASPAGGSVGSGGKSGAGGEGAAPSTGAGGAGGAGGATLTGAGGSTPGRGGSSSGGSNGTGGSSAPRGGSSGHGGTTTGTGANGGSSGCSCALGEVPRTEPRFGFPGCLLGLGALSFVRRMLARRRASSAQHTSLEQKNRIEVSDV